MIIRINVKPLSINDAWQGRRFKTPAYKAYEKEMIYKLPYIETIDGYVSITYNFYMKYFKSSDGANFEKCLSDILVKKGIIRDDRFIKEYHIIKHQSDVDRIEIEILKIV